MASKSLDGVTGRGRLLPFPYFAAVQSSRTTALTARSSSRAVAVNRGVSFDGRVESVGDWQPVLRIGHFGLHLGATPNNWVVGRPREPAQNADQVIPWILPALEKSYADVHDTLAQGALTSEGAPLWDEVVRCALLEGGEHWANCGLSWLEEGYPVAGVIDSLRRLKDAPGRSQPLRHRALRLWKASRSHPA